MRWLSVVMLAGCVTTQGRVDAVVRDAPTCVGFGAFDARVRNTREEIAASLPGASLVEADSKLSMAKVACAQHTVDELLSLKDSNSDSQQVLDGLAAAFAPEVFARLTQRLADDPELRVKVALASATTAAARSRGDTEPSDHQELDAWKPVPPKLATPELEVPVEAELRACEQLEADAALECVVQLARRGRTQPAVRGAAQRLGGRVVERGTNWGPLGQAQLGARVKATLESIGADPSEVMKVMRSLRPQVWAVVDSAKAAHSLERAAETASPYRAFPELRDEVDALFAQARATQERLAHEAMAQPFAAALHAKWAQRFGGASAVWPAPPAVDASRWQCTGPGPALSVAVPMQVRAVVRCRKETPPPQRQQATNDPMRTFDEEKQLTWQRIEGDLFVTCAGELRTYRVQSRELALEEGAAPRVEAVKAELAKAERECLARHEALLPAACDSLVAASGPALLAAEDAVVQHALAARRWGCAASLLDARYGLRPPDLSPARDVAPPQVEPLPYGDH